MGKFLDRVLMKSEYRSSNRRLELTDEQSLVFEIAKNICNAERNKDGCAVDYSSIDHPLVLKQLVKHGLTASSLPTLPRLVHFGFSKDIASEIKRKSVGQASSGLFKVTHLLKILKEFQNQGVEAAVFKGPVLSLQAYNSVAVRGYSDLDVLVRKQDTVKCVFILQAMGFRSFPKLTKEEVLDFSRYENELLFQHTSTGVAIDLHWELSRHYLACELDWEFYLQRFAIIEILGKKVKTLSPLDTVLFLSIHGAKHGWARLEWLCSLGCLMLKNDIDWSATMDQAERIKAKRMLLLACHLLHEVCGIVPPRAVSDAIHQDIRILMLSDMVFKNLFIEYVGIHPLERRGRRYHFLVQDNVLESLRYGKRLLFSPTGEDWLKSQGNVGYLGHSLKRPLRLLLQRFMA